MIKFLSSNLVDSASLTASTTNSQFPVTNIQHDFRTKVWRSTTNSDNVVFDLGTVEDIDSIAICDNWRSGFGVSTVTIEANATDSWGAPAFSTTMTLSTDFGLSFKTFTQESYRYWRLVVTSTLGYCELSNVYIGKAVSLTTNGINYNWSYKNKDLKLESSSRYGQEFIDDIGQRKELNGIKVDVMNTTELDQINSVFDVVRTVKPLFIKIGDDTNTMIGDENRISGIYKFTSEPSFSNTTAGFYSASMNFKEQK